LGEDSSASGISTRLAAMNRNSERSQRRKLPLVVISTRTRPATGTEMYGLTPK